MFCQGKNTQQPRASKGMEILDIQTRESDSSSSTASGIPQVEDTEETIPVAKRRDPNLQWPQNRIKAEGCVFSPSWQ